MSAYDTLAEGYEHGMARVTGLHAADIADTLALTPGGRALDVAAGTGAITAVLVERVGGDGLVVASDVSMGMLSIARRRLDRCEVRAGFVLTAAERLAVQDGGFDGVACAFGLQHMTDPGAALRSMCAALRPGGRCAVAVWAAVGEDIKTPINEAFAALNGERPLSAAQESWASPGALARRLHDAGFKQIDETTSRSTLAVADLDEWWNTVASGRLGDRLREAGAGAAARVRAEAYRRAEGFARHEEDGWIFPSAALIVSGAAV